MRIYTSYFGKLSKLPLSITPIAICGKVPVWWVGAQYQRLAPKWSFFNVWKQTHDNDYYVEHFFKEVLEYLDVNQVVADLESLSGGKDIALICYETPEKFCHRHLVAEWLSLSGYPCVEFESGM